MGRLLNLDSVTFSTAAEWLCSGLSGAFSSEVEKQVDEQVGMVAVHDVDIFCRPFVRPTSAGETDDPSMHRPALG